MKQLFVMYGHFTFHIIFPADSDANSERIIGYSIVETTHMAFIIVSLYTTTVNRFGNAEAILEATWSISFSVFLAMLVNCPVQVMSNHLIMFN